MKLKENQKTSIPVESKMKQKWFLVDVKGKTVGQVATKIANILRGKLKPEFTPQLDCGDHVVAINCLEIRLAGSKMDTKMYQWHTQYPGGFREQTAREILARKPEKVLYDAVWGMLPRTRTRKKLMKKLHIYTGETHDHTAQNPKAIEL